MAEERSATIVSAVPGRLRLRVDRSLRSPDSIAALADTAAGLKGVRQVQVNSTTGSLLLLYDPESVSLEELYLAAQAADLTILLPDMDPPQSGQESVSQVAESINASFGRMDRAIHDLSGGKLDAKILVPIGLGAVAVRQLATYGAGLSSMPWYVLLWYSFEMFTKCNLGRGRKPRGPE